jgi:hypothetical protein
LRRRKAWTHGFYSAESMEERRALRLLLKRIRNQQPIRSDDD